MAASLLAGASLGSMLPQEQGSLNAADQRNTVLVIDDSTSYRRLLGRMLSAWGYKVIEAEDGRQALELLTQSRISLVISDWEMPGLDGPSLCREVRQLVQSRYVYFILVTSRHSSDDLIAGMEAGADDFLSKPIDQAELRVRLRAGQRILDLETRLEERNQRLDELYHELKVDLDAAARMQRSLLPGVDVQFGRLKFHWVFEPSRFVSGDMLNHLWLDERRVGFYSIDVAGHGVKAAMMSFTLNRLLQTGPENSLLKRPREDGAGVDICPPSDVVRRLNEQFQMEGENINYFTMIYGVLDVMTGEGVMVRAGHPPAILVRESGSIEILDDGGLPVGMIPGVEYPEIAFHLDQGARLLLYTDGLTECEAPDGEQFGEGRLVELLQASRLEEPVCQLSSVIGRLRDWKGGGGDGFSDDLSVLSVGYI